LKTEEGTRSYGMQLFFKAEGGKKISSVLEFLGGMNPDFRTFEFQDVR
jgi:hypothetical protein